MSQDFAIVIRHRPLLIEIIIRGRFLILAPRRRHFAFAKIFIFVGFVVKCLCETTFFAADNFVGTDYRDRDFAIFAELYQPVGDRTAGNLAGFRVDLYRQFNGATTADATGRGDLSGDPFATRNRGQSGAIANPAKTLGALGGSAEFHTDFYDFAELDRTAEFRRCGISGGDRSAGDILYHSANLAIKQ